MDKSSEESLRESAEAPTSFFDEPNVQVEVLPIGGGVPLGMEPVYHPRIGIGGVYGAWGESFDNRALPELVEHRLGSRLSDEDRMDLASLGFTNRHHVPDLSTEDLVTLEIAVGARFLRGALDACGWKPDEVDAVLIGTSGPIVPDYIERIADAAGIPEQTLKVSVHKACDSSVGALHLSLNPDLEQNRSQEHNLANELKGKKVLVGGIEGLSRLVEHSHDANALQLFGNGAGVIGLIPGENMQFLVGKSYEVFDEEGVLAVHMFYPHSRRKVEGETLIEVTQAGQHHLRVAGMMHEPEDGRPVVMAGPMGMVKLFVRNGVQVVRDVVKMYQERIQELGIPDKSFATAIVHHANYKINRLKEKHLLKEGIQIPMPWLLSEFGNVSAASNIIAFLRNLPNLAPGDHVLIDGFGAGTYYDVLAVELGEKPA